MLLAGRGRLLLLLFASGGLSALPGPHAWADGASTAGVATELAEGAVVAYGELARLRPFLPKPLWPQRAWIFREGAAVEIGPTQRDYSAARAYETATARFHREVRLGKGGELEGYLAGQPFPMSAIRCTGDPEAGLKIAWNRDRRWGGAGEASRFRVTVLDVAGLSPMAPFEGHFRRVDLKFRVEPEYLEKTGANLFRGEKRHYAQVVSYSKPSEMRGFVVVQYRYEHPKRRGSTAQEDFWLYDPGVRRVKRVNDPMEGSWLPGVDRTPGEWTGYQGLVADYQWECIAETRVLSPVNIRTPIFPEDDDADFGPTGLALSAERWELRDVVVLKGVPRKALSRHAVREVYLDRQTLRVLYGFGSDDQGSLTRLHWTLGQWSEDRASPPCKGWQGIPEARDAKTVAHLIVDFQVTLGPPIGTRIEFGENHGCPLGSAGEIRRLIDVSGAPRGR